MFCSIFKSSCLYISLYIVFYNMIHVYMHVCVCMHMTVVRFARICMGVHAYVFVCVVDNLTPDVIPQRNLSCVLRQSSSWTWYSLIRAEWPVRKPGDSSSVSFLSIGIIHVLITPCSGYSASAADHTQVLMLVWQLRFSYGLFLRH